MICNTNCEKEIIGVADFLNACMIRLVNISENISSEAIKYKVMIFLE